ncbi:indigoidine synthase A-like protein involved in pigment biosynthesis [Legionella feeleii]|uniref:Indigoidine synthase A-like protein involved in pigment biosynthesis n=1 Tax=Legionella feeleii TaxID=453 RepID=A0A378IUW4_9GAMM|nr:indigoidine synthase A-like protein involved in pigment biosynthesis [Legionella feeleii]
MFHELLHIGKEVRDGLNNQQPIVVLESTIISHGMPYPDNLATAAAVEQLIRDNGAIPATIAFIKEKFILGLIKNSWNIWRIATT